MKYREAIEYLLTTQVQWDGEDPNIDYMCETLSELREYKTLDLQDQDEDCVARFNSYL